jgi:hypothetical protein
MTYRGLGKQPLAVFAPLIRQAMPLAEIARWSGNCTMLLLAIRDLHNPILNSQSDRLNLSELATICTPYAVTLPEIVAVFQIAVGFHRLGVETIC